MPKLGRLEPEYHPHYVAYAADPSPRATSALLKAVDPVIRLGVQTYGGGDSAVMRGRAKQLAIEALPAYDPAKASLKTHLMTRLQGLRRHAVKRDNYLGVPERVVLDHHRLYGARNELLDELGREPSDQELSDRSRMSLRRMAYVRRYNPATSEGQLQQAMASHSDDEGGGFDPAVVMADPILQRAEFLYHDLDPTDQAILERSLGMHGRRRLAGRDIAKSLGITASAVSQRASRIQKQLDMLSDSGAF
jgi:DNA-directed RNA polymerase specialized sigma subunit